jgi:hypothetical protein
MHRPAQFLGTLAAALGVAVLVLALPTWNRFGTAGLEGLAAASLATFLPGLVLVLAAGQFTGTNRPLQLLLLATGLRVGLVLLAGLLIVQYRPSLHSTEFFLGLSAFYFIALAVETRQLMADAASPRPEFAEAAPSRQQAADLASPSPGQPHAH